MRKFFVVLLFFHFACRLVSQTTASTTLLSVNEGLSQGMIFDILQSRDGFLWIATKDGLNRYDGSRFEVFSPDPFNPFAIGGSEVQTLFEDSRGWLWVSLPDGLDVLDPVSGRFFHLMHEGKPILGKTNESKLIETPDGTIWFSVYDRIWKVNPPKDMLANAAKQGNANIELPCQPILMSAVSGWSGGQLQPGQLLFTQKQKLLVGTNNGLFRLDLSTGQVLPELPIPGFSVRLMVENAKGELLMKGVIPSSLRQWVWITDSGVQFFTDPSIKYSAASFIFDPAGFLWTFRDRSIQKWGVPALFNKGKPELEIKADSIFSNDRAYCTKVMFDKSGVCWVGTNGYGVFKINQKIPKFKTFLPKDSHRLLLEAPAGGLVSLEKPRIKYPSKAFASGAVHTDFYTDLPFDKIAMGRLAVCFDPAGNGWSSFHSDSLLYRMDAVTKARKSFPWHGEGLLLDRTGNLLSVSETGLRKFDPRKATAAEFPFEKPQKRASEYSQFLYEDSEGTVWIFGFEGLTKAVPYTSGYRYEYFTNNPTDRSSLSSDVVLSVADDPLEPSLYLWVGTKSSGLNRLDKKTGKFKQYKSEQGLPDNVVYGVLAENPSGAGGSGGRHIWLSTNKGLCRFDVRSERTKNFKASDGLQDNEFNSSSYLKTRDGTMIFGGVKGLTVFHPDSLRFNENMPQIHIVSLQVNNQRFDISGKSSITLSHDQNLLTFDFAALEFTNPAQNQYRYQLVGIDKDWVALGNKNSIQFANLAPGDYTFKVEGSNNDGAWSEQPAVLRFTILPPWWASWWAYLIYLGMASAAVWLFYRYRLRQKLEHQETLRLREMDDFKNRFFTNITHEFRTPLTVILGMTERLTADGGRLTESDAKGKLGLIRRNGENLLRLINQILDLAKLESNALKINYIQGDILAFIRYIAESLHSLANAQNLMLRVESEQAKIVMDYDRERFLQIIHNLLSNAIKFTPSGGKVILRADLKDQWLHLSVADSGAGIPPEELPHLFERFFQAKNQEYAKAGGTGIGLSLTRELVRAMGGEISVESTVGVGSTFFVKLPVTNNSAFEEKMTPIDRVVYPLPVNRTPHRDEATPGQPVTVQTVLLIEDNPDVVEYLSACLQGQFYLDFAYNGQAGIEKALENVPDLIVSDVMMPIKDGFEVVETLKNDERTSHIPIILLTAKADVESRIKGLRRGADAYLSKPFHQEELLATLENLLEQRRKLQEKFLSWQLAPTLVGGSQQPTTDTPLPTVELPTADLTLEDAFLQKFRAIVEANLSDPDFEMPQLERALAMSRSQIFRKVKALTGKSPSLFIRFIRLHRGRHLLKTSNLSVSEIAYQVGYSALNNFSDAFLEEFGERPLKVRG